ncbi:MAG: thioredoxin family protein [Phycisphaerales bacterium]|nr:thioredoxin family protein [Phycisphaerales bacterium]
MHRPGFWNWITLTLMTLAVLASSARGQSPFAPVFGADRVGVEVKANRDSVEPGGVVVVGIVLDMEPGWHTHTNEPPPMKAFNPVKTELAKLVVQGGRAGPIQWPESRTIMVDFTGSGRQPYPVFEGRALIFLPVFVDPQATGEVRVNFELVFQACDDTMCDPPEFQPREVFIPIGAGADAIWDGDFAAFDRSSLEHPQTFPDADGPSTSSGDADSAGSSFFGFRVPKGLLALAFFGALGGLVLNLTPCVLPVIPLKVMALSKHASSPGRSLVLGIWMALGVVAFWLGIGLPVAFFSSVGDPSQIFGIWWVTLGIGAIIAVMGVGIMGLFEIRLPDSVYAVNPRADNAWGSFLFGVMTAVLGLPCFGFVAGALLAGSATMPAAEIMTIFGSIGVGMALPYLVLSFKPKWAEKLPKTGPASDLVKQVMGLLMLAAAMFFIGSGVMALLKSDPVRAAQLPVWVKVAHWWAVAACATAAGAWLTWRTKQITPRVGRRAAFGLVGVLFAGVAIAFASGRTNKAMHDFWSPFSPEVLAGAVAGGKVVVVDFTADWCLNCQALKATVLDRDPVKGELASSEVVPLIADLTSGQAPGWDKLRDLGQTGIPLLVIYGPGLKEPWMQNAYTSAQVMEALRQASGKRAASAAPAD